MQESITAIVHAGHLSVDNGALFPLRAYFDLAHAAGGQAIPGAHYGDDRLQIPGEQWPLVQEMLVEARLLYKFAPHELWLNIQTEKVRLRLNHLN